MLPCRLCVVKNKRCGDEDQSLAKFTAVQRTDAEIEAVKSTAKGAKAESAGEAVNAEEMGPKRM